MSMEGRQSMDESRDSLILHYAGISADEKLEENPEKLAQISQERNEIEKSLEMSAEEIILEAKRLLL